MGAGSREAGRGPCLVITGQPTRLLCPRLHKLFTSLPPFSIEISSPVVATGRGRPASRLFPALAGLAQPAPVDAKTICIGWKANRLEFARRAQARPGGGSAGRQHALRAQPSRQAAHQRSRRSTLHACDRRQNGGAEPHVWGAAEGPRGRQPRRFHQGKFASGAARQQLQRRRQLRSRRSSPCEEHRLPGCVALTCQQGDTRACRQRGDTRAAGSGQAGSLPPHCTAKNASASPLPSTLDRFPARRSRGTTAPRLRGMRVTIVTCRCWPPARQPSTAPSRCAGQRWVGHPVRVESALALGRLQ